MQEWCMEHPVMTFIVILSALSALRGAALVRIRYTRDKDKR